MAEMLEEWELPVSLVHGGFSSMLALEPPGGRDGWPLTLSDPAEPSRVLERLTVRQTALGASGVRKRDHIVDPRTGRSGRAIAAPQWVTPVRRERSGVEPQHRVAAAAVTDALTTACMLLGHDEIDALCRNSLAVRGLDPRRRRARFTSAADRRRARRQEILFLALTREMGNGERRHAEETGSPRRAQGALDPAARCGLFGYAWQKQRAYQQAQAAKSAAARDGARRSAGDQRRAARRRRAGPGADRFDAPHPGPALPRRLRHLDRVQPEARRQHASRSSSTR